MKHWILVILLTANGIQGMAAEDTMQTSPPLTRCQDGPCSCKNKCQNCSQDDPMEETLKIVLAAIPDVFAKFIQIVQNPHNQENIVQSLTAIFAHIIRIATSAFKGEDVEHRLRAIILSEPIMARAMALS